MRFTTALVAAISLSSSSAFLVTPEISRIASEKIGAFTAHVTGRSRSIDVKCHECPLILEHDANDGLHGQLLDVSRKENFIRLEFSTESGQLQVNNATIFPIEAINTQTLAFHAYQVQPESGKTGATVPALFAISIQKLSELNPHLVSEKIESYEIDVNVLGLAQTPVKAQTARVLLVRSEDAYYIASVQGDDFNPTASGQNDLEMCKSARNVQACRIKLIVDQMLRDMATAARTRLATIKEWMKNHGPGNKPRPGMTSTKPCPGGPRTRLGYPAKFGHKGHKGPTFIHGQHRHHHQRLGHKIWTVVRAFINVLLIPALVGAFVGFTVGAIGMLVGNIISALWARYRGRSNYIVVDQEIIIEGGEKDVLLVEGDEPPAYEYSDEIVTVEKTDETPKE